MRLDFGLKLEQSQKLIMTPELRQAIAVLQMSSLELDQYIEQQLQDNPLLEPLEDGPEKIDHEERAVVEEKTKDEEERFDIDWQEYFQDSSDLGYSAGPGEKLNREPCFEAFVTKAPSLTDHLNFQLSIAACPRGLEQTVRYLIGNLDSRGYLNISVAEVAAALKISESKVLKALEVLQSMEPVGVGARTLEECLMLQVNYLGIKNPILVEIIHNFLPDLAQGRLGKIASKLGVSIQEAQQAADQLRKLEPKPGRNFSSSEDTRYIVPDVVVEKIEGEYIILVNDIYTPRLRVNKSYQRVIKENKPDDDARKYVEAKMNSAVWLIKSIEQRRLTLYKVAKALVELQRDFLEYGVKFLRPLVLKDVAIKVEMHESTVSRATSNKYVQTPKGVFSMKYFFSAGINYEGGNQVSTESIKKTLQEIISEESSNKPYSDQKLADILVKRGIQISRRTVTKYRDELEIPSASMRRRYD